MSDGLDDSLVGGGVEVQDGFCSSVGVAVDQCISLARKHLYLKRVRGRSTLKELMIPLMVCTVTGSLLASIVTQYSDINADPEFGVEPLSPLNGNHKTGVFYDQTWKETIPRGLLYTPSDNEGVQKIIDTITEAYPSVKPKGVENPDDLNTEFQKRVFDTWCALDFDLTDEQESSGNLTSLNQADTVTYAIRMNPIYYDLSNSRTDNDVFRDEEARASLYRTSGYFTLQNLINAQLARQNSGNQTYDVDTYTQRYPKENEKNPYGLDYASVRWYLWMWMASVVWTISLFVPMVMLVAESVFERESKMRDLLQISGLYDGSYWSSWLVVAVLVSQIVIWGGSLLLLASQVFDVYRIGPYALLLTFYSASLFAFGLCLGFAVPKAEFVGAVSMLLLCGIAVGGNYVAGTAKILLGIKLFLSIIPPIGFTVGVFTIENYMWHNDDSYMDYGDTDYKKELPSLNAVVVMLIFDTVLYMFIAWGMPFDWLFSSDAGDAEDSFIEEDVNPYPPDDIQHLDDANDAVLRVDDLYKIYKDGTRAVKGITFAVRQGEVFSFLGSNGAGKSTTMSVISGVFEATAGDATIAGYSISRNRARARRNLGIAFQSDVIWPDISVEDHLMIFGRFRGLHGDRLRTEVADMMDKLGFPEKAKSAAGTLSGGQKRRLCVGISMVGGNRVVFLDEPTAGLDPVSRRQLWELVLANKAGRAIILTTHFMDEADVLGDRIAIVKDGRTRAMGDARFLKSRFGIGYLLACSVTPEADRDAISATVVRHVPDAQEVSRAGTELSLRLNTSASPQFPGLFEELESAGERLGVLSFGIETTTLEEVFMRLVDEDTDQLRRNPEEASRMLGASTRERESMVAESRAKDNERVPFTEHDIELVTTKGLAASQAAALAGNGVTPKEAAWYTQVPYLYRKRYAQFTRSKGQWIFNVFNPLLFSIVCGIILSNIPDGLLGSDPNNFDLNYDSSNLTPVGAPNRTDAETWAADAGLNNTIYTGTTFGDMHDFVANASSAGPSTIGASYFGKQNNFTVMYNATYPTSFPGLVDDLLSAAITAETNGNLEIVTNCRPFGNLKVNEQANFGLIFCWLFSLLAGCLGAGVGLILSEERVTLVKHQQLASGASLTSYWVANTMWDLGVLFLNVVVFCSCLAFLDWNNYSGSSFAILLKGGLCWIISVIFRFYVLSFWINDVKMLQSVFIYGNLFLSYVLYTQYVIVLFNGDDGNVQGDTTQVTSYVAGALDPNFAYALLVLFERDWFGALTLTESNHATNPGLGAVFLYIMLISGIAWFVFFLFVDFQDECCAWCCAIFKVFSRNKDTQFLEDEKFADFDADTVEESGRVHELMESGQATDANAEDVIVINNLVKLYHSRGSSPPKLAVRNMSLGIPRGEVFGLLGANGAGKTTTLKIVSGLEDATHGDAFVSGIDVQLNRRAAQRNLGLCPQFDSLVERYTVRENIEFFGRLKGVPEDMLQEVVDAFMRVMNIAKYQNKLIKQLSGGNRRKVSLASALIGNPPACYLDEPSTGLDPVACRLMWRLITTVAATKTCAIVLTTHNMTECESTCSRIGIMKLGKLQCLGTAAHLRSTHGTGFMFEMHLRDPSLVPGAQEFVSTAFPSAHLLDHHSAMLNYEIPREDIPRLSAAFAAMEANKDQLGVQDYSLSQSTLEQVFLKKIKVTEADYLYTELGASSTAVEAGKALTPTPTGADYATAYLFWLLAVIIPGAHHFWLGNYWRGVKYFFTVNEFFVGWLLDIFELHVLVRKSVEERGNRAFCGCCDAEHCCCCCCAPEKSGGSTSSEVEMENPAAE